MNMIVLTKKLSRIRNTTFHNKSLCASGLYELLIIVAMLNAVIFQDFAILNESPATMYEMDILFDRCATVSESYCWGPKEVSMVFQAQTSLTSLFLELIGPILSMK